MILVSGRRPILMERFLVRPLSLFCLIVEHQLTPLCRHSNNVVPVKSSQSSIIAYEIANLPNYLLLLY